MSERANRLNRLLAIRMLTEDLDRSAVQTALAAVSVVDASLVALGCAIHEAKLAAHKALENGERGEWIMAEAQCEVGGWDRNKLTKLLAVRSEVADVAMKKFLESRREHEQVKQLVKNVEEARRLEEVRQTQASSDEWFLSKRRPEL